MQRTHARKSPRFKKLRLSGNIFHRDLLTELQRRRIPEALAAKYLYQIYVQDMQQPERKRYGFALANDQGGYAISVPDKGQSIAASLRPAALTTFKARSSKKLFVFQDMWDFLSWMEMQHTPEPEHNIIVLHDLKFCAAITGLIIAAREQIDTVLLFMGNDEAAQAMFEPLTVAGLTVRSMDTLYQGYKNFGDYWANDPDAKKITARKEAQAKYYTGDSAWNLVINWNKQPQ